jgi:hypothetical protein
VYIFYVIKTHEFRDRIYEKSASKLGDQMKKEILIVFSETADSLRVTVGPRWSHEEDENMRFYTHFLSVDSCMRFLLKNICKRMPHAWIREEL